ncbi:MAG: fatty acid desaturase, partial [Kofleriaceae bacterium]
HHFHTNEEDIDPDCLSDLFSVGPASAARKTGVGRLVTRYQAALMPLLFPLWALTLKWDGVMFLVRGGRRYARDLLAMALHVTVWIAIPAHMIGVGPAVACYFACNAIAGLYLGAVIPVNHLGTTYLESTHELTFLEHQLATSRNVRSLRPRIAGAVFDYLFIGLNRQIEHHLFPWVPVARLPAAAEVTRAFCAERGLTYRELAWTRAAVEVARHLARTGRHPGSASTWQPSGKLLVRGDE